MAAAHVGAGGGGGVLTTPGAVRAALAGVDHVVIGALNEAPTAGLAVGIVAGDALVYARGFGRAHLEPPRPVTAETVFRIGSITKTFTAIALVQLCEQGKLRLDDPVNEHLRAYGVRPARPEAPPVTVRHLLTHTGGIGELRSARDLLRPVIGLGAKADQPVPSPNAYYAGGLRAEVPPGTKWAYANHAFATLGQVVEDVSGEPFAAYMRRHVLDPLGMAHTDYELSDRVRDRLAQGYAFQRGRLRPVDYLEIVVRGAGSMFSCVEDMARYVAALHGGGRNAQGAVLPAATLRAMWEPQFQLDPRLPAMGLGVIVERYDGHRVVGHDGGWPGFVSSLQVAPDAGLGVMAFGNTSNAVPSVVARAVLRHLLGLPNPVARLPRPDVPDAAYLWPELCGAYGPAPGLNTNARFWAGYGGEVEVRVSGGHLALRSLIGPFWRGLRLYPVDADDPLAFAAVYEKQALTVVFQRDAAGRVDRLCLGFDTLYRRPALQSLRVRIPAVVGGLGSLALATAGARRWRRR